MAVAEVEVGVEQQQESVGGYRVAYKALRERIVTILAANEEVSIADLAKATTDWLRERTDILWAFQGQRIYADIYDLVQECAADTRKKLGPAVEGGPRSRFAKWLEHSNDRHILLLRATKEDMLAAAAEREARGKLEIGLARLWRAIADELKPGQRVGDHFTPQQIDAMAERLGITLPEGR